MHYRSGNGRARNLTDICIHRMGNRIVAAASVLSVEVLNSAVLYLMLQDSNSIACIELTRHAIFTTCASFLKFKQEIIYSLLLPKIVPYFFNRTKIW